MEIMFFVLGLCVGSFINMLEYRTAIKYRLLRRLKAPRNDVAGRSFCDFCGKQLEWYVNIPVVSWLIIGGKTKCCRRQLPYQYPVVEIISGILFLLNYQLLITNYQLILNFIILTFLIFSAVFDWKYMILPDFSTYILIIISILFFQNWWSGIGSFLFLLFLHLITRGKGMGMGDVKYAIFMGIFLGWPRILIAYYMAFIGGSIFGIVMMICGKLGRKSLVPFGPFLIGGTYLTYILGDRILYYVYRWF